MGRASPFRALVAGLTADEFLLPREAVDERRCREEVGVGTLAEDAEAHRPDPGCPGRGARGAWRDGSTAAGVPRWCCRCCGRRFIPLTGTVLEHCRKPHAAWVSFIRLMCHNVPVECAAEPCGVTHKTAFEWQHRVLATVSGCQDRIVLRDTVWVDETYLNDTDLSKASFIATMRAAGMRVRPARNEVLDGIRHVATAMREGTVGVGRGCKALADELAGYVRDERSEVDRPVKVADHARDALRYGVETLRMYNRERPYRSLVLAQCRSDWQSNKGTTFEAHFEQNKPRSLQEKRRSEQKHEGQDAQTEARLEKA